MAARPLLLAIALFCLSSKVFSSNEEDWNKGTIILNSNELISGEINYNQDYEIVQCKTPNGIKAFSTYNVNAFQFFDRKFDLYRFFKVFEEIEGPYKKKAFYEIILEGEISLIRRKRFFIHSNNNLMNSEFNAEKEFDYFISQGGKIKNLRKFKKYVVREVMKDKEAEVLNFIENENLSTYAIRDQLFIIDYYNSLKDPNYVVLTKLLEEK